MEPKESETSKHHVILKNNTEENHKNPPGLLRMHEDIQKNQVVRNPDDNFKKGQTSKSTNEDTQRILISKKFEESIGIQDCKNVNEETQKNSNSKINDEFQKNKTQKNLNEEVQILQKNQNLKNNNNPSISNAPQFYSKNPKQNQTNLNNLPLQSNALENPRTIMESNKNKEIENQSNNILNELG